MASSGPYRTVVVLLTLLAVLTNALSVYERSNSPISYRRDLQARQSGPFDPPLPACIPPCGPGCVGPYSGLVPVNPAKKRSLPAIGYPWDIAKRDFDLIVAGEEHKSLNPQALAERNFYTVTAGNVDTWVANKVKNKATVQLIFPDAAGDYSSTTIQHTFDQTNKYEVGTGGLTGCSVLTIVSRRAVFMAHFFESLAFSRPTRAQLIAEGQNPDTYPRLNFAGEVTNLIDQSRGTTAGVGPSLDVSLFNLATDNTQAFIMTPRAWNGNAGAWQYTNKINSIIGQVQGLLPNIANIPVTDYVRLDMEDPAQEAELYTNARGAAFFQYDPDNRGSQAWRLFYERLLVGEDSW